jgi:beta-glucanase (GH16 family)
VTVTQNPAPAVVLSATKLTAGAQSQEQTFSVESNTTWTATSDAAWCTVSPKSGNSGETQVKVSLSENATSSTRNATITIAYTGGSQTIAVSQLSDEIVTPSGYTLVWNDEFNDPSLSMPDEKVWWYETGNGGWGNNEIQNYVAGKKGSNVVAEVSNGTLKIKCMKVGSEIISTRMNTSDSWTYGYFEARLKLPKGKGTWPAFWMMPKNYVSWPGSGEIDIMEEVGYNPNYTSSSIHCTAYNHSINTQKTAEVLTAGAQDEFHIYALEWTADYIKTYVDGKQLLYFANDKKGNNDTWPFSNPFYLKLNLAWGGNWGGAQGVDESCLPATYEIDYVRVFQKK